MSCSTQYHTLINLSLSHSTFRFHPHTSIMLGPRKSLLGFTFIPAFYHPLGQKSKFIQLPEACTAAPCLRTWTDWAAQTQHFQSGLNRKSPLELSAICFVSNGLRQLSNHWRHLLDSCCRVIQQESLHYKGPSQLQSEMLTSEGTQTPSYSVQKCGSNWGPVKQSSQAENAKWIINPSKKKKTGYWLEKVV